MSQTRHTSLKSMINEGRAIFDYLPEPFTRVLVHCEDYSCMAYLDEQKIWRSRYNNQPIVGRVVAWETL